MPLGKDSRHYLEKKMRKMKFRVDDFDTKYLMTGEKLLGLRMEKEFS